MDKVFLIGLMLALTACGGGGGGEKRPNNPDVPEDPGGSGFVSINPPDSDPGGNSAAFTQTSTGVFQTELTQATFNGGVSVSSDAECNGHTGFDVTITNAATSEVTNASERVDCSLIVKSGRWQAASIPLVEGNNRLTASGAGATASITVVRLVEPPTVLSASPGNGSIDFAVTGVEVQVTFSEDMASSSINSTSFFLEDPSRTPVPGIIRIDTGDQYNDSPDTARFASSEPLDFATTYTAHVTTAVTDAHGNPLADAYSWSFTTVADIVPPNIVGASPVAGDTCATPNDAIAARFDKLLDPATLSATTFALEDSNGLPVAGNVTLDGDLTWNDHIASFTPTAPLAAAETYTAHLKPGITDLAGNAIEPRSWSFTTPYAAEGSWTPITIPADLQFIADFSVVWTGAEMIVWGGYDGDGVANDNRRYDPALDQWGYVTSVGAPSRRYGHSGTWIGTEMIVWGGRAQSSSEFFGDGARYDPAADAWLPMSATDAPSARNGHTAVWTGTELIVWGGGLDQNNRSNTGARYDPATDTWTPMSTINAPAARYKHHAVFDGERMIVWGGEVVDGTAGIMVSDGGVYDPVTDVWSPLPAQNAPDVTKSTQLPDSVVLAGSDLMVWSPWSESLEDPLTGSTRAALVSEARRYNGVQAQWNTVVDACESGATPNAVWLNGRMLSWNDDFTEGYAYGEQRDIWHPITAYPGAPMSDAAVIAIGDSVIAWDAWSSASVGYRLAP